MADALDVDVSDRSGWWRCARFLAFFGQELEGDGFGGADAEGGFIAPEAERVVAGTVAKPGREDG